MPKLSQENEALLLELHKTQEDLERKYDEVITLSAKLSEANKRLERINAAHPNYLETGFLSVQPYDGSHAKTRSQWTIQHIQVNSYQLEDLHFSIDVAHNTARMIFQRYDGMVEVNQWLDWKSMHQPVEDLVLSEELPQLKRSDESGKFLNTKEFLIASRVPETISRLIKDRPSIIPSSSESAEQHIEKLSKLFNAIAQWPTVFRYNKCELLNIDMRKNYQGLRFKLSDVSINGKYIPFLEYTLSSIDGESEAFGSNPRLEFDEIAKHAFDKWFIESNDERGGRLELRFATPSEMDLSVWHKLSDKDKILIVGLISELPSQLGLIKTKNSYYNRHQEQWRCLAISVKNIMKAKYKAG